MWISTISRCKRGSYYLFLKGKKRKDFFSSTVGRSIFVSLAKTIVDGKNADFLSMDAVRLETTGAPMPHTVHPIVVPAETLAKMFVVQTSVLTTASFLSCLLKYQVTYGPASLTVFHF